MHLRYNGVTMTNEGTEVEDFDQDRIDKVIWRNADVKPVKWIADQINMKPEYVLRRKRELMEGIDSLDIQQTRYRLVSELNGMARDARERAGSASDEFYAGTINAASGAIKTMLSELARMEKADKSKVESLNQKRIQELVSLIREVVDISVVEIASKHNLDEQELYDTFNRRMAEAAEKRDLG